jgi:hypothetical protein
LIADGLGMEIEPIVFNYPENAPRFDLSDGLKHIQNGSIDTIAMTGQTTVKRLAEFSFSKTLYKVKGSFLIHQSGKISIKRFKKSIFIENVYNSVWSFVQVFDFWTWLAILIVLLIQCGLCILIRKMEVLVYNAFPITFLEVRQAHTKLKIKVI